MLSKSTAIIALTILITFASLLAISTIPSSSDNSQPNLQTNPSILNSIQVTLKSVSSVLRTTLSRVYTVNDTVYAGDYTGAVGLWFYDAKKKKLEFMDFSRQVSPFLPPQNKVLHL